MATLTLKSKIVFGDKTYEAAEIDEATVGGVEAFEAAKTAGDSDTLAMIKMLVVELDWPIEVVRKMKSSDMAKIAEALAPLAEADGVTGA